MTAFDFDALLSADARTFAAPASRWGGFPPFHFVGGNNDPDGVPVEALRDAAAAVIEREGRTLATYNLESGPQGYSPLRAFVANKVARQAGIECSADDVLITSGSLQGLDLVNQLLVDPGDTVLVEQFSYGGALSRLRRCGAQLVGLPLDDEGIRADALESTLERLAREGTRPKFIYTIPTVQNPTAAIMGLERRQAILDIATRFDVAIFEDECYSDLIWAGERPPALRALDTTGRVIHIGSFSKSIAPALRVGYLIADWPVMSRLLANKQDAGSGAIEQMMLAEFCARHFDSHVAALNERLHAKARTLCAALAENFGTAAEFVEPEGGIFLWVKLPEAVDTLALFPKATAEGVHFNPGPEWATDAEPSRSSMRICFANPGHDALREGIARLAQICARETGVPERIANRPA